MQYWILRDLLAPRSEVDASSHNFAGFHSGRKVIHQSLLFAKMVDATARLTVLLNQEDVFYRTSEYLERLQHLARRKERAMSTSEDEGIPPSPKKRKAEDCTPEDESPFHIETPGGESPVINKHWREKICEWAYQGKC